MRAVPSADNTLMLAGPGVVRAGCAPGLRRFADVFGLAVANTWGAKGLFEWRSEHHMGTVGLQALDFRLLGFAEADLLLTCGVDLDEAPRACWDLGPPVLELAPQELDALAASWQRPRAKIRPNDFLTRMAAAVQPLFREQKFPLSPGRAVANYRGVLDGADLLAADPGATGFWVARAFPTTVLGSIDVPARAGVAPDAASRALTAARSGRRALAVTTRLPDGAALDAARREGLSLVLDVWSDDPVPGAREIASADEHAERLRAAWAEPGVHVLRTPIAWRDVELLTAVAGPIVVWPGVEIPFADRADAGADRAANPNTRLYS